MVHAAIPKGRSHLRLPSLVLVGNLKYNTSKVSERQDSPIASTKPGDVKFAEKRLVNHHNGKHPPLPTNFFVMLSYPRH